MQPTPLIRRVGDIFDDDIGCGGPPTVQFSSSSYSVNENGGSATITVTLSATSSQTVTVDYATADMSAQGGEGSGFDYKPKSGTLTFQPGETAQSFTITIVDDATCEVDETINLSLGYVTGGASQGNSDSMLTIVENEVGCGGPRADLDIAVLDEQEEDNPGGLVVWRNDGNNAPRKRIRIQKPANWTGNGSVLVWNLLSIPSNVISVPPVPVAVNTLTRGSPAETVRMTAPFAPGPRPS